MKPLELLKKPKGFIILFLMLALPITLLMTQQRQDNRQRASEIENQLPLQGLGRLEGFVFEDTNTNGIYDSNEKGISEIEVQITDEFGASRYVTTQNDGRFLTGNLPTNTLLTISVKDFDQASITTVYPLSLKLFPETVGNIQIGLQNIYTGTLQSDL